MFPLFARNLSPASRYADRRRRTTRVSPVQPLGLFNPWVAKHESRRASPLGRSVGRDTSGDHEGSRPHRVRRRAASRRSGRVAHPSGQERQPTRRLDEHGDSTRRAQQRATPAAVRQDAGLQVMVASRRQGLGSMTTRTRGGSDGMVRRRHGLVLPDEPRVRGRRGTAEHQHGESRDEDRHEGHRATTCAGSRLDHTPTPTASSSARNVGRQPDRG